MSPNYAFLDLVNLCDNCHVDKPSPIPSEFDSERLVPWHLTPAADSPVIGLLRPIVVEQLIKENERSNSLALDEVWDIQQDRVNFKYWLDTSKKRSTSMHELCVRWQKIFPDVCGTSKWRNEQYPVYADPFGPHDDSNYVFEMERSACACFGVVTYGVHMTLFQEAPEDPATGQSQFSIWVPTRSLTKQTWPGYLDNSVAGGVPAGRGIFDSLVKECWEEASLPDQLVCKYAKATGSVSYFLRTSQGWLQPEVEYVYDMRIPNGVVVEPTPCDGEVQSFEFLPHAQVASKMRAGLFKPNCALVLIDFFIRHGIITPETEPDYMKIITRLHGRFDYERWSN